LDEKLKILTIILIIFFAGFITRLETVELRGLNNTEKAYYTDEKGLPYMYEPDCYYSYRLAANILDHGHPGDKIINGTPWDLHSFYPPGRMVEWPPLILWLSIIFYKFLNLFTVIDFMESCFWLPAIIGPLAGIVMFFFVRRYAGNFPGLLSGVLLVLAPFYFFRTVPGFFDTDMFNIFFPLIVVLFFCKAIETNKNYMPSLVLSSLLLALFSLAWNGWPYIFYIIIVSSILYMIKIRGRVVDFAKKLTIFIIISLAIIGLLGRLQYISIFTTFFEFTFKPLSVSGWPGIYESIAELHAPTFDEFLSWVGPINIGLGFFGTIIIGSIMLRDEIKKVHLPYFSWYPFILIVTWLIIGIIAYSLSIRFALLVIPPLIVFLGLLVGVMDSYLKHSNFRRLRRSGNIFILTLVVLLSTISFIGASEIQFVPFVDDDFVHASYWIKNETSQDIVVITQWGYGCPLESFSQRPVLIDGMNQCTPRTYWFYHAFATNNESLSIGILGMLSTSGNQAIELLDNKTGNTSLTVTILDDILGVGKKEAEEILEEKYRMDSRFTRELLSYTHPANKPFIILTRDDMIRCVEWYIYYGFWDFNKSKGRPYIYSIGSSNDTSQIRYYSNNVKLDLDNGGSWENKKPYNTIIKDGNSKRIIAGDDKSNFSIIVLLDKNQAIVLDKSFQDSLFVKLVILKEETEHIKQVYKNNSTIIWAVR